MNPIPLLNSVAIKYRRPASVNCFFFKISHSLSPIKSLSYVSFDRQPDEPASFFEC